MTIRTIKPLVPEHTPTPAKLLLLPITLPLALVLIALWALEEVTRNLWFALRRKQQI